MAERSKWQWQALNDEALTLRRAPNGAPLETIELSPGMQRLVGRASTYGRALTRAPREINRARHGAQLRTRALRTRTKVILARRWW